MKQQILQILQSFETELLTVSAAADAQELRVKFLGKQGLLTSILRGMKDVAAQERPLVGTLVNEAREQIETKLHHAESACLAKELEQALANERIDITEPANPPVEGAYHPLTNTFNKLVSACVELGFEVVSGPEVEYDYYNFEALNLPKDHPARDMQDSFFLAPNILLRTQTSSVQIREMEQRKPPFKIVSPGKTYRVDNDPTHTPMFHQFEGLVVDENVSLVDLKSILTSLLKMLFGKNTSIRFRPSFFPFTEPSVEVDCTCPMCGGSGCTRCKMTGWMELLGAGMVNPKVLENCGIDSNKYTGFAFGFGVDRLTMVDNKIPDLRMMFENDIRFLSQLK